MTVQTPQDLFQHELQDIYDAEHRFVQALGKQAQHSTDPQVKSAFEQHQKETEGQIENLDGVFETFGWKPKRTACYASQGLVQEYEHFIKEEDAPDEIVTAFTVAAGCKVEHYEIATYTGLVEKARLMGQDKAAQLLEQNLQQEQATAQKLEQLGTQLAQQSIKQTSGSSA